MGVAAVESFLLRVSHRHTDLIISLLSWVLQNSYVEFNGAVYKQLHGTAMGTSVAVCFAVLFMSFLDEMLLAAWGGCEPLLHLRFIDDGLLFWGGSAEELQAFLECFDNLVPSIKLTWVVSETTLDFLDITMFKGPRFQATGRLDVRVYQKPVNTYLYLPYSSYHPLHCKTGFIVSELNRYLLRSTSSSDYLAVKKAFYWRLRARGYPMRLLQKVFSSRVFSQRHQLLEQVLFKSTSKVLPSHGPFVLKVTYSPLSERLALGWLLRRLKSALFSRGLTAGRSRFIVAWKLSRRIRHFLVHAKMTD